MTLMKSMVELNLGRETYNVGSYFHSTGNEYFLKQTNPPTNSLT